MWITGQKMINFRRYNGEEYRFFRSVNYRRNIQRKTNAETVLKSALEKLSGISGTLSFSTCISKMALGNEVVLSSDPQGEEDADLVDPQDTLKESCSGTCEKFKSALQDCNTRVNSRTKTAETCTEELFDFVHCVDNCVAKDLFTRLK